MNPPPFDWGTVVSVYGPLGLMTMGSIYAALKIWRIREEDRAKHQAELKIWEERYIKKSESAEEQYYELAKSLGVTLDEALRRLK